MDEPAGFWASIWDFFGVLGDRGSWPVLAGQMPSAEWFGGATLNYARNALRTAESDPGRVAVVYSAETGRRGQLTFGELRGEVARLRAGLQALGVGAGDRVAAYLPNSPEALIAMLATASLGAIWTSCSPDFGAHSVIDRFAQISPRVLLAVEGYVYGGKRFDRRAEVAAIAAELPGLAAVITVPYAGGDFAGKEAPAAGLPVPALAWSQVGPGGEPGLANLEFAEVPFSHPLWVLYSSGTTGLLKPIVHSHGGIVLEHLKALSLHQDLSPADTFFWYATTGWMMWNYLAGGLLAGARVVLYDGSAVYPDTGALWRLADETGVTYAGTGAPYLLACMKEGMRPAAEYDLSRLRGVGSTGSPLPPEGFHWVYDEVAGAGQDLILGSFSGGTDLCTGFVGPNPLLPVRAGVISGPFLGAKAEAFDPAGRPLIGEVGELVLTQPMPSMPVGFWNDPGGVRYRDSYFAEYPGVWRHGDWITILHDGGCIIYGRSDATLNPRRRPDGHQRVLPGGRTAARDRRQPRRGHRPARSGRQADPVRRAGRGARAGRCAHRPDQVPVAGRAVAAARARPGHRSTRHPADAVREETRGTSAQDPARHPDSRRRRSGRAGQPRSAQLLRPLCWRRGRR